MKRIWNLGRNKTLTSDVTVTIEAPDEMTHENFERLRRYVNVLEQEYSIAWPERPPGLDKPSESSKVLAFMQKHPGPFYVREVCEGLGLEPKRYDAAIRAAVRRLEAAGEVVRDGQRFTLRTDSPPAPPRGRLPSIEQAERDAAAGEEGKAPDDEEPEPLPKGRPITLPEDIPVEEEAEAEAEADEDSEVPVPRMLSGQGDLAPDGREWPAKKRCSVCRIEKLRAKFAKNGARHDGLQSDCRDCQRVKPTAEPRHPAKAPALVCAMPGCAAEVPASKHQAHLQEVHGKALGARQALAFFRIPARQP